MQENDTCDHPDQIALSGVLSEMLFNEKVLSCHALDIVLLFRKVEKHSTWAEGGAMVLQDQLEVGVVCHSWRGHSGPALVSTKFDVEGDIGCLLVFLGNVRHGDDVEWYCFLFFCLSDSSKRKLETDLKELRVGEKRTRWLGVK